jgi:hypothetical protein
VLSAKELTRAGYEFRGIASPRLAGGDCPMDCVEWYRLSDCADGNSLPDQPQESDVASRRRTGAANKLAADAPQLVPMIFYRQKH